MILASYEQCPKSTGGGYARGDHIFVDPRQDTDKRRFTAAHEVLEIRCPDIPHEQIDVIVIDLIDAWRQLELI